METTAGQENGAATGSRPEAVSQDTRTVGSGESYWGLISPADSAVAFIPASVPTWERVVDAPHKVLSLPVRAVSSGVGAAVVYLDEHHVIYRIQRLLRPREIPFGFVVSMMGGSVTGFGLGVTVVHDAFLGDQNRFRLGVKGSENGHITTHLGIIVNDRGTDEVQIGAGFRDRPNVRFYGVGPDSDEDEKSFYNQELGWVGLAYQRSLAHAFAIEPRVLYSEMHARGPGEGEEPPLDDTFADDLPLGWRRRSDGLALGLSLVHDDARETGRPEAGGYRRVTATWFTNTGRRDGPGADDFWTYRAEIQEFIPLWYSNRALAVRGFGSWIDRPAEDIPFQRLMTNDDPDLLRGYDDFRFADRGMAALSVEYRWPVWAASVNRGAGLDGYIFSDVGQVFGEPEELSLENVTTSFGGGLRLVGATGRFAGRVEIGVSREATVLRLRADQIFQFEKGDLYHGRNPVPFR